MPDQSPSMPPLPEPSAYLITGGRVFVDAAVCSRANAEQALARRNDGATLKPLYTADHVQAVADERVREAQQWRPIETAPKDGTHIIAFRPSDPPHIEGMYWATYEDADRPGGWHWSYDGDAPRENLPTHWLPLPPVPTLSLGTSKGAT